MGFEKINSRSNWWQKILTFTTIICMITMTFDFTAVSKSFYLRGYQIKYGGESRVLNYSNSRSDAYEFTGDVRLEGSSATVFIGSMDNPNIPHTIKPYARKGFTLAMYSVSAFQIKAVPPEKLPHCTKTLDAPAILFSTARIALNYFHSVSDVMVPLFATSQRFNRNVIFLVTNHNASCVTSVHRKTIETLSKYEVVDIDRDKNRTLCFTNLIVGLKAHPSDLSIDPSPLSSLSTRNLTRLLRTTYSLKRDLVGDHIRPRMLIVSRTKNRKLMNELELLKLARMLGFDPAIHDLGDHVEYSAKIVNTFDIMVAVHGSALTNMLFLPENAVVIQIIPWGLDDQARMCFAKNPQEMKLKYLEYKIAPNESSFLGNYSKDSLLYTNPLKYRDNIGQPAYFTLLVNKQNVNLDLARFKDTLLKALDLMAA